MNCQKSLTQLVVRRWPAGLWLLFSFLIDPESFRTDAGPASHRVRLWRGGPESTAPLSSQSRFRFRSHLWYSGQGPPSWFRGRFYDDVGSARQCANTAKIALPLSMVLVLAYCLPNVTPSAFGKRDVDDFLGVHATSCWCQEACGPLGTDSACTGQPFPMCPQFQSMLAFREWTEQLITIIDTLWPSRQVRALRFFEQARHRDASASGGIHP